MSGTGRFLVGLILSLSLAVCGLALGTVVGGRFFVPAGQGLAGPAEALAYGVLAALGGVVLGVMVAFVLRGALLKTLTLVSFVLAAGVVAYVAYAMRVNRAELDAYMDEQISGLPPFVLTVLHSADAAGRPFASVTYDGGRNTLSLTRTDGSVCSGRIPPAGREKAALLGAIRNVELVLANTPVPCTDGGPVLHEFEFSVEEALPPNTTASAAVTQACLAEHPELQGLIERADYTYANFDCN
jgi:hypothetical protein